jgi:hypothetical protein
MYLVRAYKPSRGRPRRGERAKCPHARTYRRLHRAPWLIASSLPHEAGSSQKIKKLYAQRMQIEETFRDTKSHRWGFGLHYARCNDGRRLGPCGVVPEGHHAPLSVRRNQMIGRAESSGSLQLAQDCTSEVE